MIEFAVYGWYVRAEVTKSTVVDTLDIAMENLLAIHQSEDLECVAFPDMGN